jgi:hypothetical protein
MIKNRRSRESKAILRQIWFRMFLAPSLHYNTQYTYSKFLVSAGDFHGFRSLLVPPSSSSAFPSPQRRNVQHLNTASLFVDTSTNIRMPCLGSARLVFDLPAVPVSPSLRRPRPSLCSLCFSFQSSISTPTRWPPRRAFLITAHSRNDFFDYTSGRWM